MATLAFRFEEITPRELKPELYELDGISRATIEAHYKLYQGYVNKRNEILQKLDGVDTTSAGTKPFNVSISTTGSPRRRPKTRHTFVPPMFPLPSVRMSTPFTARTSQ